MKILRASFTQKKQVFVCILTIRFFRIDTEHVEAFWKKLNIAQLFMIVWLHVLQNGNAIWKTKCGDSIVYKNNTDIFMIKRFYKTATTSSFWVPLHIVKIAYTRDLLQRKTVQSYERW